MIVRGFNGRRTLVVNPATRINTGSAGYSHAVISLPVPPSVAEPGVRYLGYWNGEARHWVRAYCVVTADGQWMGIEGSVYLSPPLFLVGRLRS